MNEYSVELFKSAGTISGIKTHSFKSLQEALTFTHSIVAKHHRHITLITINHKGGEVFHFHPESAAQAA